MRQEISFAMVAARKGMTSFDGPIYVIRNVNEEGGAVAALKALKNIKNLID
jgi:hypothetical protein